MIYCATPNDQFRLIRKIEDEKVIERERERRREGERGREIEGEKEINRERIKNYGKQGQGLGKIACAVLSSIYGVRVYYVSARKPSYLLNILFSDFNFYFSVDAIDT